MATAPIANSSPDTRANNLCQHDKRKWNANLLNSQHILAFIFYTHTHICSSVSDQRKNSSRLKFGIHLLHQVLPLFLPHTGGEKQPCNISIPHDRFSTSTSQNATYRGKTKLQQFYSGLFHSVGHLSRVWKQ